MGEIAIVESSERAEDEGAKVLEVQCDPGGGALVTAEHYSPPGDDSRPLPGDTVALQDSAGAGRMQTAGYLDAKNEGKSGPGEKRLYARDSSGTVVAEFWLKGNGDIDVKSLKAGSKITLNKLEIDQDGNVTTPGKVAAAEVAADGHVTAGAATPAAVKLLTHTHPVPAGPGTSSPPTPGS